jgi:Domain of unknown function (DUF4389)
MTQTDDLDGADRSASETAPDPQSESAVQPAPDWPARADEPGQIGYGQIGYGQAAAYEPPVPAGYGPPDGSILAGDPSPILVKFGPPARQGRVSVLFRGVIAIPHIVVLYALGVGAEVVALIGWFVALFTGKLPESAHAFITGVVRWQTRVYAYLFMLTGAYPPFSLDDDAYPVRLVTRQTSLNRVTVLFRILVAIPAAIVTGLAASGLAALSIVAWLITLVTGQLPPALHQAGAAIVRYAARYYGFFFMVTGEYPRGLYGDSPAPDLSSAPDLSAESGIDVGQPTEVGQPVESTESGWQLALSGAARALITVALVLGVVVSTGYVIAAVALGRSAGKTTDNLVVLTQLNQANHVLGTSMTSFPTAVKACGGQLECVTALDLKLARSLETFAGSVKSLQHLSGLATNQMAANQAAGVISDARAAAKDLTQLGSATSVAQYQQYASNNTLQRDLNDLSGDYAGLLNALGALSAS